MSRTRAVLVVVAAAGFLIPALMILRVPTPIADAQLYASIARATQLYGVGVPTITWNSPAAVDHLPFYGPVFYQTAARFLDLLGPRLAAFRLASVCGTLLLLAAAALLTAKLSQGPGRWLWTVAILLLTPEVNAQISNGLMHVFAIGLLIMAFAVFAGGQPPSTRAAVIRGVAVGALLVLAALTTPRSYPFIAGFLCAGARMLWRHNPRDRREERLMFVTATASLTAFFLIWTFASHGGPVAWARYFWFIFTHEDTDVAILPTAVREFRFRASGLVTPLAAIAGMLAVAAALKRRPAAAAAFGERGGIFVVTAVWIGVVLTAVVENYTFTLGGYIEQPLLAVLLSTPRGLWMVPKRTALAILAVVLVNDVGLLGVRYARVAATWDARDPAALNTFIGAHVPPGSAVVGPEEPYFFAVERADSRYRTISPRSWADWARWVPLIEPEAALVARRWVQPPPVKRFFIWPAEEPVPDAYQCALRYRVAQFEPAPTHLDRLGPFGRGTEIDRGYPASVLYELPSGCPTGYDPTRPAPRSN